MEPMPEEMKSPDLGMPWAGLRGKIAIVTGVSRRQGIGAAICRAFASCGVDILFTHWRAFDRQAGTGAEEEGPHLIEQDLRRRRVRVASLEADLSLTETPRRVLETVVQRLR